MDCTFAADFGCEPLPAMRSGSCWIKPSPNNPRSSILETGASGCVLNFRKRPFWQSRAAVLAGNAIYFSVERFLPPRAQHELYQIDWGLAVDFWVCLVCYGLVRLIR